MKQHDYIALAKAIKHSRTQFAKEGDIMYSKLFIPALCDILKADNPRFDENKFRELLK